MAKYKVTTAARRTVEVRELRLDREATLSQVIEWLHGNGLRSKALDEHQFPRTTLEAESARTVLTVDGSELVIRWEVVVDDPKVQATRD